MSDMTIRDGYILHYFMYFTLDKSTALRYNVYTIQKDVRILSLKDIRKETGLTQKVFAKKYHIPVRTLQDWEQERRRTPPYVIFMLKTIQEYEKKHKRYRIRKIKK